MSGGVIDLERSIPPTSTPFGVVKWVGRLHRRHTGFSQEIFGAASSACTSPGLILVDMWLRIVFSFLWI
jgi:hypothetical protein